MDQTASSIEAMLFGESIEALATRLSYVKRLERMWILIVGHYSETDLSLQYVARAVGVSRNHLNVLLRCITSLTFHQLLIRYRILKATEMMISNNHTILEVALANGFGSLNSFERNFRSLIGTTPIQFKTALRSVLEFRGGLRMQKAVFHSTGQVPVKDCADIRHFRSPRKHRYVRSEKY